MIPRTRFRGGIHLCYPRYTFRQQMKNLIIYITIREEKAEQIDVLGMGYEI